MGPVVKQLLIAIIVPVLIEGETRFALVRSPNLHTFAGLVATDQLPRGWHAVVSDATHRIIAASQDAFGQELPPAQRHHAGSGDVFEFVDSEGRPSSQAYAWSELTGWQTAVWVPKALLQAPVRALWWGLGGIALMAFAIVVTLALWLGLTIARSIGHAARAAIASGEDGAALPGETPVAEVNALMAELRGRTDLLRDSERQLRVVTDNVQVALAYCDSEARYKFVNRHYSERRGLTPEQVIGKTVLEVVGEKAWATFEPYFRECLAGKAIEFELEIDLTCAGEPQYVHCSYEPEWRDDKVVGLIAAITNITCLKRAEAALRESEATFRAMFDVSSVGKIEVEPQTGRFLRANTAMCEFVGYTEAELLRRTVYDIAYPGDLDYDRELCERLDSGESAVFDVEKRYVRKDGGMVWARTTVNVIRDEFGRPLRHTAVIQDLSAHKQAEQALQASKDRLQFALDAALLGWWRYDPLHRVVSGDTRFKEIFDVTSDRTSIEEFMKRVHPDDAARFWANREAALDPASPKPYAHEYRVRRRDGEIRWVEGRGLGHFEGAGPERRAVSLTGTVQDITERKEREEKEYFLTREVNHRAKNMLSVVQVIAHHTAAKNIGDFIDRFSKRIQALSANQDLLIRSEWNGVEIADLVHAQLSHFADLIGSRIAARGPKLRLNPASAQTIGLVIHELSTNAGKYGALSTDKGRVDIFWGTSNDTLTISWTERDGPHVPPPPQRGFGTTVIEAMVEYNVRGVVDLDYAPLGLTWRLACPAANALER
jgi:PAS domain S-box-containing protein